MLSDSAGTGRFFLYVILIGASRSEPHTSETTKESGCGLYHTLYSRKDPVLILRVLKL